MGRKDISIIAKFTTDGVVIPQTLIWEDEQPFSIDKVTDIRKAASRKAGGIGLRYTCMIHGKQVYLFKDADVWFMEVDD